MSKTPISASSDAAGTSPIPWSCAAGIRCVPIRPVVDAPQMKKLPVRSQKVFEWRASSRPWTAPRNGLPPGAGGSATSAP